MRRQARHLATALLILALATSLGAGGCTEAQTSSTTTQALGTTSGESGVGGLSGGQTTTPGDPAGQSAANVDFDLVPATVSRVVDGDTAVMTFRGTSERVRFIGVDTPESTTQHEPYGEEASAFTKTRLSGKQVWLQIGTEQRDKYGRLLAYVWLEPPSGTSDAELRAKQFNAQLLLEGYAQLLTIAPNVDYVEQYRRFQTEARDANRGLWALPTSGSAEPALAPTPARSAAGGR